MAYDDRGKAQAVRNLAPKSKGGKGQTVKLYTSTGDTYSPSLRKVVPGAPATYDGSGIESSFDARNVDGEAIKQGDAQFMLSPVQLNGADMPEPKAGDKLEYANEKKLIVSVAREAPAGMAVYYMLQVRG